MASAKRLKEQAPLFLNAGAECFVSFIVGVALLMPLAF
jgi:hypothetical protein